MSSFVYVDNSNIWIEGRFVSAVKRGFARDIFDAHKRNICDTSWSYDFGKLLQFAGGQSEDISKATLFGSRPPKNDSLWTAAEAKGFTVVTEDRNFFTNKEKKIDSGICTMIMEDSFTIIKPRVDEVVLVAGDRDYVPTVESLKKRDINFILCFWEHAARELLEVSDRFFTLNPYLEYLRP